MRTVGEKFGTFEGYVVDSKVIKGRIVYKISMSEELKSEPFDNWIPEDYLELWELK